MTLLDIKGVGCLYVSTTVLCNGAVLRHLQLFHSCAAHEGCAVRYVARDKYGLCCSGSLGVGRGAPLGVGFLFCGKGRLWKGAAPWSMLAGAACWDTLHTLRVMVLRVRQLLLP